MMKNKSFYYIRDEINKIGYIPEKIEGFLIENYVFYYKIKLNEDGIIIYVFLNDGIIRISHHCNIIYEKNSSLEGFKFYLKSWMDLKYLPSYLKNKYISIYCIHNYFHQEN